MEIRELELYTSGFTTLKSFYTKTLGLLPIEESQLFFSLKIGNTILKFAASNQSVPYHFAITISANKEFEALQWLKQRVDILKYNDDEIVDFINWNAKSVYFYDTDKNIVEFIARKNLPNQSEHPFSEDSLVEVSEIGMPTDNIENTFNILKSRYDLDVFDGNFDKFCAVGDERGLFIVIDKYKKKWFPTDDVAETSNFKIKIGSARFLRAFEYKNGKIISLKKL